MCSIKSRIQSEESDCASSSESSGSSEALDNSSDNTQSFKAVRKCEANCEYVVSDKPAWSGQFLCEKYHPKRHDKSNISRREAEADKLEKKVETIKDTIAALNDSLFSERTGKLQTGLTGHYKFNSDSALYLN